MPRFFLPSLSLLLVTLVLVPKADAADAAPGSPSWLCDSLEQTPTHRQQCLDALMAGVADKRIRFDRTEARRCHAAHVAYIKAPTEAGFNVARQACGKAVVGQRATGAACDSAMDCREGLVCVGVGEIHRRCQPPIKRGAPCDEDILNATTLAALLTKGRGICGENAACRIKKGERVCVLTPKS